MNTKPSETLSEEILRNKVIQFPDGLPGFPNSREFLMAQRPEERPFAWLQSITDSNLSFAVVDAYAWCRDFALEVDDAVLTEMGSLDPIDYAVYFILQFGRDKDQTTLQARPQSPVIVNIRNRQARQIVLPTNSSVEKAEALCLQL